jgi:hypothetical protein
VVVTDNQTRRKGKIGKPQDKTKSPGAPNPASETECAATSKMRPQRHKRPNSPAGSRLYRSTAKITKV